MGIYRESIRIRDKKFIIIDRKEQAEVPEGGFNSG
jgi:hypothetical protein